MRFFLAITWIIFVAVTLIGSQRVDDVAISVFLCMIGGGVLGFVGSIAFDKIGGE